MSKLAESIVDSGKDGMCVVDKMLDYMKILKECINDLQKDYENKLKTIDNFTDKLSTLDEKIRYLEDELSEVDNMCRRIINVKKL